MSKARYVGLDFWRALLPLGGPIVHGVAARLPLLQDSDDPKTAWETWVFMRVINTRVGRGYQRIWCTNGVRRKGCAEHQRRAMEGQKAFQGVQVHARRDLSFPSW